MKWSALLLLVACSKSTPARPADAAVVDAAVVDAGLVDAAIDADLPEPLPKYAPVVVGEPLPGKTPEDKQRLRAAMIAALTKHGVPTVPLAEVEAIEVRARAGQRLATGEPCGAAQPLAPALAHAFPDAPTATLEQDGPHLLYLIVHSGPGARYLVADVKNDSIDELVAALDRVELMNEDELGGGLDQEFPVPGLSATLRDYRADDPTTLWKQAKKLDLSECYKGALGEPIQLDVTWELDATGQVVGVTSEPNVGPCVGQALRTVPFTCAQAGAASKVRATLVVETIDED